LYNLYRDSGDPKFLRLNTAPHEHSSGVVDWDPSSVNLEDCVEAKEEVVGCIG
jgi:hypothetical protein